MELDGDGYEARLITNVSVVRDTTMNFKLSPVTRIAVGETTIVTLHPNDVGYDFPSLYEECAAPCKLLRVSVPGRGSLSIVLTARDPDRQLSVITEGGRQSCCYPQVTIPLEFSFADEAVLYVKFHNSNFDEPGADQGVVVSTSFTAK